MKTRYLIFWLTQRTKWSKALSKRMYATEVGFSGHISTLDDHVAKEGKLKPLNRFEKWYLKPIIEIEKELRMSAFKEAVLEVTGESI